FTLPPTPDIYTLSLHDALPISSARAIAEELSRELKVAIIPVNRPGAGGALGTDLVVKAKPDGYTIILTNNASLVFRSILDSKTRSEEHTSELQSRGHLVCRLLL